MARANRIVIPGMVWHLTHRCHKQEYLLKFQRDRERWRYCYWLFQAVRRFDFCVLNYIVTSNHVHLLVVDDGNGAIAKAMQLIAGRTAQEFNLRKQRNGAWRGPWGLALHLTRIKINLSLSLLKFPGESG